MSHEAQSDTVCMLPPAQHSGPAAQILVPPAEARLVAVALTRVYSKCMIAVIARVGKPGSNIVIDLVAAAGCQHWNRMLGTQIHNNRERQTARRELLWQYSGDAQDRSVLSHKTVKRLGAIAKGYTSYLRHREEMTAAVACGPSAVSTRIGNPLEDFVKVLRIAVVEVRLNSSVGPLAYAFSDWVVGCRRMLLMLGVLGYHRPFHAGQRRPQMAQYTGPGRLLPRTQQDKEEWLPTTWRVSGVPREDRRILERMVTELSLSAQLT